MPRVADEWIFLVAQRNIDSGYECEVIELACMFLSIPYDGYSWLPT